MTNSAHVTNKPTEDRQYKQRPQEPRQQPQIKQREGKRAGTRQRKAKRQLDGTQHEVVRRRIAPQQSPQDLFQTLFVPAAPKDARAVA